MASAPPQACLPRCLCETELLPEGSGRVPPQVGGSHLSGLIRAHLWVNNVILGRGPASSGKDCVMGGHTFLPSSGHLQDRFEILFTVQAQ